jgi:hypothetical protein
MSTDDDTQNTPPIPPTPADSPESAPAAVEPDSGQTTGSNVANTPPEPPESPINDDSSAPVEDQNPPLNQPESDEPEQPISAPNESGATVDDQLISVTGEPPISEPIQSAPVQLAPASAPTPQTPIASQTQLSAQQEEVGFIHSLLIKAQAKIQSNKQKKLYKIVQLAQNKKIIANEDVQKLLRISSATATRYLVKLVQQGHLIRVGSPRDAKYQFVR